MDLADDGVRRAAAYERLPGLRARRLGLTLAGRNIDFVDWGYYPPSRWRNYLHNHSYFEVCFAYAGEGRFRLQDSEFDISPGTAFVARPGDLHEIDASTLDPLGIAFWSLTVGSGTGEPDWLAGFTDRTASPVTTRVDGVEAILDLLAASLSAGGGDSERADALARTLAVETVRRSPTRPCPRRSRTRGPPTAPHWPLRPCTGTCAKTWTARCRCAMSPLRCI